MSAESVDWASATPIRHGEMMFKGDQTSVYNPETGGLHVLNQSALAIWELCDGETTGAEMVEAIVELARLEPGTAEADVSGALQQLFDLGLVRR